MYNTVVPKPETCYSCHKGTARPRENIVRTHTEIIVEAIWVCPNCGSQFKRGTVSITPINRNAK